MLFHSSGCSYLCFLCSFLALNTMAFILLWRCIVCSGKSSSCLPLKIKLHSPPFIFPPFSTLSSSSSSSFTPSLNIISELLTKDCGFSSLQVTTVMRRAPRLLRNKSDQTAREVIHLLRDSGFTENKLKILIVKNPTILLLKVDSQLKPKMEFLKKMGLATQDIAHMALRTPRLLASSLENSVVPRILHLETIFGSKVHLCKALRVAPQLLTSDFERQVKPKVEYLKNSLGILEGSTAFARALNAVIGLSFETLEAKTKHMASLGLAEEEISQILKVLSPGLLLCIHRFWV
ncbi:transcription termination factor MTEF1, chloroplastic-like isoform X2 [Cryptomeria japonica]|uniref:transcription termination factor MTEF1, chloroplastic-like isoform X2 n=1 Tax=Cryptomeria japonica TaxID=3369 RepID=UPI0027D9EA4C|nr:transcription termination factor MTEF1, chloroplastic-like isoform X2 [Cryptomeria japonica]